MTNAIWGRTTLQCHREEHCDAAIPWRTERLPSVSGCSLQRFPRNDSTPRAQCAAVFSIHPANEAMNFCRNSRVRSFVSLPFSSKSFPAPPM